MAFAFSVNQACNGASDLVRSSAFMFKLKELLKANGWTVQATGTGNTGTFGSSDLWVTAASIVGEGAWARMKHTATGVEFIMATRATSGAEENMGWLWSRTAGFTSGGSATVPPTATDQVLVADRTATNCVLPVANFTAQFGCDNATPAFFALAPVGVSDLRTFVLFDWLTQTKTGDAKPGVMWATGGGSAINLSSDLTVSRFGGGYQTDDATVRNRAGVNGFAVSNHDANSADPFVGLPFLDPRTGKVSGIEVLVFLDGTNAHLKGVSRVMQRIPAAAPFLDTLATKSRIVVKGTAAYSFPWDGVTTPSF